MGYDLLITRANFWAENEDAQIRPEEWLAIIESDSELSLVSEIQGQQLNSPYFVAWNGESIHAEPWLDWADGNIYSKNPDQAIIRKMVSIGKLLKAKVQGEDGEEYDGSEEGYLYRSAWE